MFSCPQDGLYWLFYTFFINNDSSNAANITVVGLSSKLTSGVYCTNDQYFSADVITRDHLRFLTKRQQLTISSGFPIFGNETMESSWGGIRLDSLMSPLVAFEVSCASSGCNGNSFGNVILNIGNGWDTVKRRFVAPVSGIYYFSGSVGLSVGTVETRLTIGPCETFANYNWLERYVNDGRNIVTGSCLLNLNSSDVVIGTVEINSSIDATIFDDFTFRGFLYSPTGGGRISWYLSSYEIPFINGSGLLKSATYSYFDSVYWSELKNKINIGVSGNYFVDLSASSTSAENLRVGLRAIDMRLLLNNSTVTLRLYFARYNCNIMRNRAAIVRFQEGDELSIDLQGNIFSHLSFNFIGFLLYPN